MAGRKRLRWSLIVFAVIVLLAAGTLTLLPRLVDTAAFRAYVAQVAGQVVGRPVKFASLSVSLLPLPNVTLRGLEIADDPRFGATPVLRVGEAQVRVRLRPLLSLRIELASVTLDKAQVQLVVSKSTDAADGIDLSSLYAVDNNVADVISVSFGQCEKEFTATEGLGGLGDLLQVLALSPVATVMEGSGRV